jgi:hypothetical protein
VRRLHSPSLQRFMRTYRPLRVRDLTGRSFLIFRL